MDVQHLFGKIIRGIRSEMGISQEKFALKIGMDRTYYSSVELGNRNISLKNMIKISNGLDVPLSILFKLIEEEQRKIGE